MRRICVALIFACYTFGSVKAAETPALPTDVPPMVGTAIAIPDNDSDYYSVQITVLKIRWSVVGVSMCIRAYIRGYIKGTI